MSRYHQSPACWPKKFYWAYLQEYGLGVTYRSIWVTEITQMQSPTQCGWQLVKAGNLEHGAQQTGAQQVGECPSEDVNL